MPWQLEPSALAALRDQLIERGAAASRLLDDGVSSRPSEPLLRRLAPFLELLYLMMVADGKCEARERQLLRGVVRTLGGPDLVGAAVEPLLTAFDANLETAGAEGRLETVASALTADRLDAEAAFTLTATMALADGDVDAPEHAVLDQLAEMLGISSNRARELATQRPLTARTHPAP